MKKIFIFFLIACSIAPVTYLVSMEQSAEVSSSLSGIQCCLQVLKESKDNNKLSKHIFENHITFRNTSSRGNIVGSMFCNLCKKGKVLRHKRELTQQEKNEIAKHIDYHKKITIEQMQKKLFNDYARQTKETMAQISEFSYEGVICTKCNQTHTKLDTFCKESLSLLGIIDAEIIYPKLTY